MKSSNLRKYDLEDRLVAQIFRMISLQSFNNSEADTGGQVRIFTIGFLTPAPTRIPEDINVRCSEGQPLISLSLWLFATDTLNLARASIEMALPTR